MTLPNLPIRISRGTALAGAIGLAVVVLALLPVGWARAQCGTAGCPTSEPVVSPTATASPTSTATASATATGSATATSSATPAPTATPTAVPVVKDKPVTIPVPLAGLSMNIAPNTFGTDVVVTFTPLTLTQGDPNSTGSQQSVSQALQTLNIPPPPAVSQGSSQVVNVFQLAAVSSDSGSDVSDTPSKPITVALVVTPEVLALAGNNVSNVSLQYYDEDATPPVWVEVPCTGSGDSLSCDIPHFSTWALVVKKAAVAQPSITPQPANTGTGLFGGAAGEAGPVLGLTLIVVALGIGGGLGARALRRRAR